MADVYTCTRRISVQVFLKRCFGSLQDNDDVFTEMAGTVLHCPPEYFLSKSYRGKHADAWALGLVLYSLVTDVYSFHTVDEIKRAQPDWQRFQNVPASCLKMCKGLLTADPNQRLDINSAYAEGVKSGFKFL